MSLHDPALVKAFLEDKRFLETTQLPVVTVTGTFQEDLKRWHGLTNQNTSSDIVYSRAHFSMAYGFVRSIWGDDEPEPHKAWLVDPTNYVHSREWSKIVNTEKIGKLLARTPFLKSVKDVIDKYGRSKLPILDSITPPLLYLFENVDRPIISFHIAAGNILAKLGKPVIQVITDPHVREDYLTYASLPNLTYCVFDEMTKVEALEKAHVLGVDLDPNRVIVTGPPIDLRIIQARQNKKVFDDKRPLRIAITTGGLGTNKPEIREILRQLLPEMKKSPDKYQVMVYCGTQEDIFEMVKNLVKEAKVRAKILKTDAHPLKTDNLTIIYHPQLFDANELLIKHAFSWADVFITKPSGDMAYDATASGSALLTLNPWGVWEERIASIFEHKGIARVAQTQDIIPQLNALTMKFSGQAAWVSQAMKNAKNLEKDEVFGVKHIVEVARKK